MQLDVDMPDVEPYKPAAHSVHELAPPVLYVPSGQMDALALVEPATQAYPGKHAPLHKAVVNRGADPNLPPGHALQIAAPWTLNVPAKHFDDVAAIVPLTHE